MSMSMYQGNVTRAERDLGKLETELGKARDQHGKAETEGNKLAARLTGNLTVGTRRSLEGHLEQQRRWQTEAQKKIGDLQGKIATKREELNRERRNLDGAQKREDDARERKVKQVRTDQLRHEKAVTDELRRQAASSRPLVIDRFAPPASPASAATTLRERRDEYADRIYLIEIETADGNIHSGTAFL